MYSDLHTIHMKKLICTECGKERESGRRLCRECYLESKRVQARKRYRTQGRYMYRLVCIHCGKTYEGWRKEQKFCSNCWNQRHKINADIQSTNCYQYVPKDNYRWEHRKIAECILKRALRDHEVVHHLDNNPQNNDPSNLSVLTREMHSRLHGYLHNQRLLLGIDDSRTWNNMFQDQAQLWLDSTQCHIIYLSKIEPLYGNIQSGHR